MTKKILLVISLLCINGTILTMKDKVKVTECKNYIKAEKKESYINPGGWTAKSLRSCIKYKRGIFDILLMRKPKIECKNEVVEMCSNGYLEHTFPLLRSVKKQLLEAIEKHEKKEEF